MVDGTVINAGSGTIDLNADENIAIGSLQTTSNSLIAVTIDSTEGAITDAGDTDVDIVADSGTVIINAVTGIGSANALEITISTLNAVNTGTAGNITFTETNGITINRIQQSNAGANGNISLTSTTGTVTLAAAQSGVTTSGSGTITLFADGGAAGQLTINAGINSTSGTITLRADDDVTFAAAGDVTSTSGAIEVTADFDNGGAASGALTMVNGTVINAGSAVIDINADENIAIGSLQTTSNSATAITIDSTEGGITDAGDTDVDIVADSGTVVINAVTGIGSVNALETAILTLNAVNSGTAGNVRFNEVNGITVNRIQQSNPAGNGNINLNSATGTILLAGGQNGVTTAGSGTITLFADGAGAGQLTVNAAITTTSGTIILRADDDVTFSATGDVTSTSGAIEVTADFDNGGAASGAITMVDTTVINAGSGTIDINADENIAIGSLQTTNTSATAITIDSTEGAVTDAGDTDVDIVAAGGTVVISAVTGIGSTNAIETTIATLTATNSTSGHISLIETNALTIGGTGVRTQGGNGNITIEIGRAHV